jgi:hypothetical protein
VQRIIEIIHVEEKQDRRGKTYWRTHAILSDGTEAIGWGKDFDLGTRVSTFFHHEITKMKKYKVDKDNQLR